VVVYSYAVVNLIDTLLKCPKNIPYLLVNSPYLEWNTIENTVLRWNSVFKDLEDVSMAV
jgi:hypothetical protein